MERFRLSRITPGWPVGPLVLLFGLNAVDELDRAAFNILTPEIRDHFDVGLDGILTLLGVVTLLAFAGQVLVGYYADRFPRVRIATLGAAVWALFTLGTGLAPTILLLGIARVGSSLGKAVVDPTHNSLISDYYPPEVRVKAFGFHRAANSVGQIVGPLLAGGLAYALGFRAPFILFAIPTAVLVVLCIIRLREPVRGAHERRSAGADEETAMLEEQPPSLGEAWRMCHSVRTLRRIFYSLPFLGVAIGGLPALYSIQYNDEFGLNEIQRSIVAFATEPFQLVGLAIGIPLASRLAARDPGLVIKLLAVAGGLCAVFVGGFAIAPNVQTAIAMNILSSAVLSVLSPGIYAAISLTMPPRVRATGFSIGAVYLIPAGLIIAILGQLAEGRGIRGVIFLLLPILAGGFFILASAGSFVAFDMKKVQTATLAQSEARRLRLEGDPKLLLIRDLDVAYGQTQVLFGVDFHVDEGEIVALLGTNGAGKSTLLNAISGLVEPRAGAIVYDGHDFTMADANATVAAGIVFVPGGKGVFPTLTVEENINLAGWLFRKDPQYLERAVAEVLEYFPILEKRWNQKAGNLSGGEQQMLTLGQAFIAQPKLLMIDELSLGLAPVIVEQLLEIVRAIHARGTTVILVEQSVNVAMSLAERAVFMEKGEVRFDGPTAELLDQPDILRAVFLQGAEAGRSGGTTTPAVVRGRARSEFKAECEHCGSVHPVALETTDLSVAFGGIRAVNGVDLSVRQGEILGLIGPNGAGKTTIFDLISGYLVPTRGRITFLGEDVTELSADRRAVLGLGRSFQDARLFPSMTVRETIAVGLERHIPSRDPLAAALASPSTRASEKVVTAEVDRLIELMHLEAFADKFVGELSTGSRRVVDIACSMAHDPKVLLLDEPSSGIAQRETEALGPLLLDLRDKTGAAIIVIEHDMPLITSISDEMIALELGAVIARGAPDDVVNHPRVVESYLGGSDVVINRSGTVSVTKSPPNGRREQRRARRRALVAAGATEAGEGER
jgi:ABC-type branched-subunit amino acid transport system ATPase component